MPTLQEEEATPTSDSDLRKLLGDDVAIVPYPQLSRFATIQELLGDRGMAMILFVTDQGAALEGHWLCLFEQGGAIHYFDPYGLQVDGPFAWLPAAKERALGQTKHEMTRLLRRAVADGYEVYVNRFPYQKKSNAIATCGDHCVARLRFRNLDAQQYHDLVTADGDADAFVTRLTSALLNKDIS